MSWRRFEVESPELARFGAERLAGQVAYLATIRKDGGPRLHPVTPFIGQGHLFLFIDQASPKGFDLRRNGHYALHCAVNWTNGCSGEFLASGVARVTRNPQLRALAATLVGTAVPQRQVLFDLAVHRVVATTYGEKREPTRFRWRRRD